MFNLGNVPQEFYESSKKSSMAGQKTLLTFWFFLDVKRTIIKETVKRKTGIDLLGTISLNGQSI